MKRTRNKTPKNINAWSGQGALVELPVQQVAMHVEAPVAITHDESSPWKSLNLLKDDPENEWFSKINNLSGKMDDLAELLRYELGKRSWLNVFLLSAGMGQIVEDYLHTDPFLLGRAARFFGKSDSASGRRTATLAMDLAQTWNAIDQLLPRSASGLRQNSLQADFTSRVAALVMGNAPIRSEEECRLIAEGNELIQSVQKLPPALREDVNKLPSCFRSFDQSPEDILKIVEDFSSRWPDRGRAIEVVGVRTSGSFLAPLYQAALQAKGYERVRWFTLRPGTPLLSYENSLLRSLKQENGLALICDDPPDTGETLFKITSMLERQGISRRNVVLLLELFEGDDHLPKNLKDFQSVTLEWSDWHVQEMLEAGTVRSEVESALKPGFVITGFQRTPLTYEVNHRKHSRATYQINLVNTVSGNSSTTTINVKGVGLGYFGEHFLAVSRKLPEDSLPILLLKNGLVYEEVPEGLRPASVGDFQLEEGLLGKMIDYVVRRNQRLQATEDLSLRLTNRNAVWEVASNILSLAFGKTWYLFRMPLLDAHVKRLLSVAHPSVIDGDMSLHHWLLDANAYGGTRGLFKTNLAERDFSHEDLSIFDPAYDLAALALVSGTEDQSSLIRRQYSQKSGDNISPERWMLHQLVRIWDMNRHGFLSSDDTKLKMSRVFGQYFSDLYFTDIPKSLEGPLCVFDIDGVLETHPLGFASLTFASARSLRALELHGYRILIASGRSLEEVKERSKAYHLAGGIAEYGSAIFDSQTGETATLLTREERDTLDHFRISLASLPGVNLDRDFSNSVRAFYRQQNGSHKSLNLQLVKVMMDDEGFTGLINVIPGSEQTDFVVSRVNKAAGVKAWMARFGSTSSSTGENLVAGRIELAVGDNEPDLEMLQMAEHAFAPGHAAKKLKDAGITIFKQPYQRGLEQGVTKFLGHKPGGCSICQMKEFNPESSYIQDVISLKEAGKFEMVLHMIALFLRQGMDSNVSAD